MADAPTLVVSADPVAAASDALAGQLLEHLAAGDGVRLAIPGGSALLALPGARDHLGERWSRVALTWVDERCVPEADEASNRGAARRLGLLKDPAPLAVVRLFEDGEAPDEAVKRAEAELEAHFHGALDVLLLGLGEDGHVASLFPSRPAPGPGRVAWVADSPKPPAHRITLTHELLGTAASGVLLAAGDAKRDALERLFAGDSVLPAHGLHGLHVVTDQEISR